MVNQQRICDEFARQAAIASPSYHEGDMARYLEKRFRELGAEVVFDRAEEQLGSKVGNMIARFAAVDSNAAPLMLSVHMDTVSPCIGVQPLFRDGVFYSAGETVLGADDKAGIAEIIEALEVLREQRLPQPPLEVVVTICEEVGLVGAKQLDLALVQAKRGLALDTNGVDKLIHRAPGANKLRFEVVGREAHAGIAPERGISAIEVVSRAVAGMPLGRIDAETTANIGTIHGGTATNIVARQVVIEGEVRSHDADKLQRYTAQLVEALQQSAREMSREIDGQLVEVQIQSEVFSDYPIMHVPRDAAIIALAEKAAGRLGRTLDVATAGGGSDANIFNCHGIETVILGTGMTDVHTVNESVSAADLVAVAELLVEIISQAV